MQDADRPAQIQVLTEPAGACCPRAKTKPLRIVLRPEQVDGISGHRGRRWHFRQEPAVRLLEPESAVGPARNLIALFVHRAVVPATEQREIRQRGGAALRPVTEVVALGEAAAAARKAAVAIPMVKRAPQSGGNRARPGPDLQQAPVLVVAHHHPARITCQAPGRFRGTRHVAAATPRRAETPYDHGWRVQRAVTLLVLTEPDAEPAPGRFEVPRRVDTACAL